MFTSIISKSLRDFLDAKILFVSLLPITLAAIFWALVFYVFQGPIDAALESFLMRRLPFFNADWAAAIVGVIGGIFIYYELLLITAVMIVGLIADIVVGRINNKQYRLEKRGFGTLTGSVLISLRSNAFFIVLFVITLPLLFVPVFNVFVHLFLWVLLIKSPLFYDSIAMFATREEYQALKSTRRWRTRGIAYLAASLFLIPVVGVFIYVLQLIFFAHYNLQRLADMRGQEGVPVESLDIATPPEQQFGSSFIP